MPAGSPRMSEGSPRMSECWHRISEGSHRMRRCLPPITGYLHPRLKEMDLMLRDFHRMCGIHNRSYSNHGINTYSAVLRAKSDVIIFQKK
jgi:hypothetical protein